MRRIKLIDDLHPEDNAMLQALYSRSDKSVEEHLEKLRATGSGKFMERFYVGYNHRSIADCGSTTLFFEGVSLLAAKAIQDWPLYAGQETSTRYIDMGSQPVIDPVGTMDSAHIICRWMDFYNDSQDVVADEVRRRHPRRDGEDEKQYEGAVKARTFDILRGFLPAGICTQLSWHTNLRQAGDHLVTLEAHPSAEIAGIGSEARNLLRARYEHSGFDRPMPAVTGVASGEDAHGLRAAWEAKAHRAFAYSEMRGEGDAIPAMHLSCNIEEITPPIRALLADRPRGCVIPHKLGILGSVDAIFRLDFGSYRDIQRHRAGVILMPLLTQEMGFSDWYLEQLPDSLRDDAIDLLDAQKDAVDKLTRDPVMRQYYIPLGYEVDCTMSMPLPAFVYVLEVRSSRHIHPTLRHRVLHMAKMFREDVPEIPIHIDDAPDDWTVRRGTQTITEKGT